jgi:hypothetical protein
MCFRTTSWLVENGFVEREKRKSRLWGSGRDRIHGASQTRSADRAKGSRTVEPKGVVLREGGWRRGAALLAAAKSRTVPLAVSVSVRPRI